MEKKTRGRNDNNEDDGDDDDDDHNGKDDGTMKKMVRYTHGFCEIVA